MVDRIAGQLRLEAKRWLERPSFPDEAVSFRARYGAAIALEDATDVAGEDTAPVPCCCRRQ